MLAFELDFADALIDIDRKLTVKGAPAHTELVIHSKTERAGQIWRSQITVQTDEHGMVNLADVAPSAGSYTTAQPMGLIYTQLAENAASTELFPVSVHHALHTELEAHCAGQVAKTVLTQRLTHATVQRVEINQPGFHGIMFVPSTAGDKPAVMVLKNQSAAPLDEAHAALYAARGYIALALDYAQTPSLDTDPEALMPFKLALAWLRTTMRPKHNFVAVSGYQQGAELALLLGVQLADQVSAVIACEPTAAVRSPYPLAVENSLGPILLASGQQHVSSQYHHTIGQRLEQAGFDYNFQWYDFEGVGAGLSFAHVPTLHLCPDAEQALRLAAANKELWFAIIGFLHQAVIEAARPTQLHA